MKVLLTDNQRDHYLKVKAIAEADAAKADDPAANPSDSALGLLIADAVIYAIESATNIHDAHLNIHAFLKTLEDVHEQIKASDHKESASPKDVDPTVKTFVN